LIEYTLLKFNLKVIQIKFWPTSTFNKKYLKNQN
jgi:hypothetical protein